MPQRAESGTDPLTKDAEQALLVLLASAIALPRIMLWLNALIVLPHFRGVVIFNV